MKKFLIAGFFAISACLVSCEEEDVPDFVNQDYLSGTWITKEIGTPGPFNNGSEIITYVYYEDVVNDPACEADNLVLNPDRTFALNDFENTGSCVNQGVSGTYTRMDNRILLNYTNDMGQERMITMTVNTLTYTQLIVSYTLPGTTDLRFFKFDKQTAE